MIIYTSVQIQGFLFTYNCFKKEKEKKNGLKKFLTANYKFLERIGIDMQIKETKVKQNEMLF